MSLNVSSTVKHYPRHPYQKIQEAILGKKYDLSLVFVGTKRAATLNQQHRNKSYTPNVLSFPLTNTTGEIFICPQVAKGEAARYDLSLDGYVAYLFIHGCLHLKGLDHGATMDKQEQRYLRRFGIV